MKSRATWQLRRLGLVLCLVTSIVVGFSGGASAHTDLTQSYPAAGQVIEGSVGSVDLTFTDVIVPELSQLVVRDKAGRNLAVGRPSSFGSRLSARLAGAESRGSYRVTYRVVAADGHPVVGSFRFVVRSGADTEAGPDAAGGPALASTDIAPPSSAMVLPFSALAAVGVVLALRLRFAVRKSSS